jgi:hypothetical protein
LIGFLDLLQDMEANSGSWEQPDSVLVPENTLQALLGVSGPDLTCKSPKITFCKCTNPVNWMFVTTAGRLSFSKISPL